MIELKPGRLAEVSYVAANMRGADRREIFCQLPEGVTTGDFARAIQQETTVAFYKDNPVGVYWFSPLTVSTAFASMFGTNQFWRAVPTASRHIRDALIPHWRAKGFRRFEARTHVDHKQAHRWLEWFGAVNEGRLENMGRNGEDFFMYALTYKD